MKPNSSPGHPPILSYGLINSLAKLGEALCLMIAGLDASRGSGQLTLLQAMLLPLVTLLPYRLVRGEGPGYYWHSFNRMLFQIVSVLAGVAIGSLLIELYAVTFHPPGWLGDWLWRWAASAAAAILALRLAVQLLVRRLYRRGGLVHRVAIIGAGPEAEQVIQSLLSQKSWYRRNEIVGIFDERIAERRPLEVLGHPVQEGLEPLLELALHTQISSIIITWPVAAAKRIAATMEVIRSIPADILVLLDFEWLISTHMRIRPLERSWYLQVSHRPLIGTRALLKACEDYVVASIGILVTAPIMLIAALAIWREGSGPILFRQRRIGFNNNEFEMLKFRSMVVDNQGQGRDGTKLDDPRVTKVGRFLRRSSIDELPQLFNVLRGEMSIVGPRAHVPNMLVGDQTYNEMVAKYAARHRVKPGITGWAQINGMRGGITNAKKAHRGVELDLDYIDNWSIWLDLVIMVRTLFGGLWGPEVF